MLNKYAVIGNPIEHSRSPIIHQQFAAQENAQITYDKILATEANFEKTIQDFFSNGGDGMNVTVPFKQVAYNLSNELTPRAQFAASVNTLKRLPDGTLLGDTTDGEGIVCDIIKNLNIDLQNKSVLILGAGGAVASIIEPLFAQKIKILTIVNRTLSNAQRLADQFNVLGKINIYTFENLTSTQVDIIINGTTSSLNNQQLPIPNHIFSTTELVYDMFYTRGDTSFLQVAKDNRAPLTADGLGMLVEQAAVSYHLWRGFKPNTQSVIEYMRQQLAK